MYSRNLSFDMKWFFLWVVIFFDLVTSVTNVYITIILIGINVIYGRNNISRTNMR